MAINLGSIFWSIEVANAADAAAKTEEVQQQMGKTAEKAERANEAVNQGSSSMGSYSKSTGKARNRAGRLSGTLGILSSAFFFLTGTVGSAVASFLGITSVWATVTAAGSTLLGVLTGLGAYLPTLAGIVSTASAAWGTFMTGAQALVAFLYGGLMSVLGTIVSLVSGFVSWLAAGSAGALATAAAIGALIGVVAVGILEWTGLLDIVRMFGQFTGSVLPGWVRDGLIAILSIFVGILAVIGAAVVGFVKGFLRDGLGAGIDQMVATTKEVLDIFAGAWDRQLTRVWKFIKSLLANLPDIGQVLRSVMDTAEGIFMEFLDYLGTIPGKVISLFATLGRDVGSALAGALEAAYNAATPGHLQVPQVTVGGGTVGGQSIPEVSIGGQRLNIPQLQTGGLIKESGLFMGHSGEMVVPADTTRNMDGGGSGGSSLGGGTTIEELNIEIGDQTLDLSNLTRSDLDTLADEIASRIDSEASRRGV